MSEKSSSTRKPTKESSSGRGRSPPSSSRQSKEKAEKVKTRTPTPHPAKRSAAQLFGPHPPTSSSAVPVSPKPRPRVTVGQTNVSVSASALVGDDDLWDSQNSPGSPAVSPPGPVPAPASTSSAGPAGVPTQLPATAQPVPGLPVVSSLQSAPPVGHTAPPFVAPLPPATQGFSSVAGPPSGMDGAALRAPPPYPAVSALPRPLMPPVMTPWMQGTPWNPYQWSPQFPATPGFPPPPGFSHPWSLMSSYSCPPPPGFDDGSRRRPAAQSSPVRPEPGHRSSTPGRRSPSVSDASLADLSPQDQWRSRGSLRRGGITSTTPDPRPVHLPTTVTASGVPEVGYSVHALALDQGAALSETEVEVSDSYSAEDGDEVLPPL